MKFKNSQIFWLWILVICTIILDYMLIDIPKDNTQWTALFFLNIPAAFVIILGIIININKFNKFLDNE